VLDDNEFKEEMGKHKGKAHGWVPEVDGPSERDGSITKYHVFKSDAYPRRFMDVFAIEDNQHASTKISAAQEYFQGHAKQLMQCEANSQNERACMDLLFNEGGLHTVGHAKYKINPKSGAASMDVNNCASSSSPAAARVSSAPLSQTRQEPKPMVRSHSAAVLDAAPSASSNVVTPKRPRPSPMHEDCEIDMLAPDVPAAEPLAVGSSGQDLSDGDSEESVKTRVEWNKLPPADKWERKLPLRKIALKGKVNRRLLTFAEDAVSIVSKTDAGKIRKHLTYVSPPSLFHRTPRVS
jgi:hypothetical protein